ncbi:MAG TPA: isoaspartyl peptidase/L-asparaginase [Syntrophorhabdaceae bacterium]|jgi:L-asparaginase/beta-aspartyl-peptidase (threonine type)
MKYGIAVHGGAGAPEELKDGCEGAARKGLSLLGKGGSALDAVCESVRLLEDDGRFNAGTGAILRLDGKTREMDAAIMDSSGAMGIVIAIREIRNPVLAARAVSATPHVALAGVGATSFARSRGLPSLDHLPAHVKNRYERMKRIIASKGLEREYPHWAGQDVRLLWNFDATTAEEAIFTDTVGAVAMDRSGLFAVASSTGGASPMLLGRVGDTAMAGCGFYAGPLGAIAVTGLGEEIIRRITAKTVYDRLSRGETADEACAKGVAMFPDHVAVGVIVISGSSLATAANRPFPAFTLSADV